MEMLEQILIQVNQCIPQSEERIKTMKKLLEKSAAEMSKRMQQAEEEITQDTDRLESRKTLRNQVDGHPRETRSE